MRQAHSCRVRVGIFTDNDFDKINGVTTTLKAVLQFGDRAMQPRVYAASDLGVDSPSYFAAASVGIGLPWYQEMRVYWPPLRAFARQLRRDRISILHVTTPGPVGLAARWLSKHLRLPLVGSYHTEFGDYVTMLSGSARFGGITERYVRWFYRTSNPLLVPSGATRDLLIARGYRPSSLRVWGRGVDVERFDPSPRSTTLREDWRGTRRSPLILYAGRLSKEKGLALAEPLRRRLSEHGVEPRFVFVGDGPMRRELQQLIPDGIFLGALPHERVAVAMASADAFFFPSATDTLGNVVLEAQAAGLPVVVSDRGGPRQHMAPHHTGFICTAGDVDAFARAFVLLFTQPELRSEMSRAAREYALSRDWPKALIPLHYAWLSAAGRGPFSSAPFTAADASPLVFAEESSR
jgi:glycosyltransferase involved in cell wall biosynthesis